MASNRSMRIKTHDTGAWISSMRGFRPQKGQNFPIWISSKSLKPDKQFSTLIWWFLLLIPNDIQFIWEKGSPEVSANILDQPGKSLEVNISALEDKAYQDTFKSIACD